MEIVGVMSQQNTNQIFLYLNRGLQNFINDILVGNRQSSNVKKDMEEICYDIINEHNIEIKTHIVTLINNRVQQYMKLYNLKVKHAR